MDIPELLIAILTVATAVGTLSAAYFLRGRSTENRKLLESNILAYKDAEALKDQEIAYWKGQSYSKDKTIEKLSENSK